MTENIHKHHIVPESSVVTMKAITVAPTARSEISLILLVVKYKTVHSLVHGPIIVHS